MGFSLATYVAPINENAIGAHGTNKVTHEHKRMASDMVHWLSREEREGTNESSEPR
jgi:hypothetical protein